MSFLSVLICQIYQIIAKEFDIFWRWVTSTNQNYLPDGNITKECKADTQTRDIICLTSFIERHK